MIIIILYESLSRSCNAREHADSRTKRIFLIHIWLRSSSSHSARVVFANHHHEFAIRIRLQYILVHHDVQLHSICFYCHFDHVLELSREMSGNNHRVSGFNTSHVYEGNVKYVYNIEF